MTQTYLSLIDKEKHFDDVFSSMTPHRLNHSNNESADLNITCVNGEITSFISTYKILVVSQSELLKDMLTNNSMASDLVLVDVDQEDVRNLLTLLSAGR